MKAAGFANRTLLGDSIEGQEQGLSNDVIGSIRDVDVP